MCVVCLLRFTYYTCAILNVLARQGGGSREVCVRMHVVRVLEVVVGQAFGGSVEDVSVGSCMSWGSAYRLEGPNRKDMQYALAFDHVSTWQLIPQFIETAPIARGLASLLLLPTPTYHGQTNLQLKRSCSS